MNARDLQEADHGTPLVGGRYFDARDEVPASRSIVIDERLARRFWPDGDAVGQRMFCPTNATQIAKMDASTPWLTVIGVVRTARLNGPAVEQSSSGTSGTYYLPYAAAPPRDVGYVIRTEQEWTGIVREVRSALARIDPEIPLYDSLITVSNVALSGAMSRLAGYSGRPEMEPWGRNPRYNIYPTRDGKFVTVCLLEYRGWKRFCDYIGRSDLAPEEPSDVHTA